MKPSERLQSLDALRGFDMLFIMGFASLVVAVCGLWPNAVTDSIASQMGHASWDGFTHHDTIFPLFLFIAGVSFPFAFQAAFAGVVDRDDLCKNRPPRADAGVVGGDLQRVVQA